VTTTPPAPYGGQAPQETPVCPRHPDRASYVRCQRCERPVCPECQRPAPVGVQCVDCVRQQARGGRVARTIFGGLPTNGRPVVTLTIMAVCVGLFLLQLATQDSLTRQLDFYPPQAIGQPYRFVSSAFLHSTSFLLHIVFNLYALWMVGPYLESLLGRAQFAVLYLLSAAGGSVGVYVLTDPNDPVAWATQAVGASGAVFGLFGAFLVVNRKLGRDIAGILGVLLVNAVISALPGIAWQAHLGGFVTGVATAVVLAYLPSRSARARWGALAAVAVVLLAAVAVRTSTLPPGAELTSSAAAAPGAAPVAATGR
jgi:membrane associated rhomboid family serine protease